MLFGVCSHPPTAKLAHSVVLENSTLTCDQTCPVQNGKSQKKKQKLKPMENRPWPNMGDEWPTKTGEVESQAVSSVFFSHFLPFPASGSSEISMVFTVSPSFQQFHFSHRVAPLLRVDALSRSWQGSTLGLFSVSFESLLLLLFDKNRPKVDPLRGVRWGCAAETICG